MKPETKFVNELKRSWQHDDQHTLIWKLRGTAATAGRPDLFVVNRSQAFLAEVKINHVNKQKDLLRAATALQRANMRAICDAGGRVFLITQVCKDIAIVLDLYHCKMYHGFFTEKFIISVSANIDDYFTSHDHCPRCIFYLFKRGKIWTNINRFAKHCEMLGGKHEA